MISTKDRIGYIRRTETDAGTSFKYIESKITSVRVGSKRTSVYSKNFRALDAEELEENTEMMRDNSKIVLVGEPFVADQELSDRIKRIVDYWNEHGAESLLGERYEPIQ